MSDLTPDCSRAETVSSLTGGRLRVARQDRAPWLLPAAGLLVIGALYLRVAGLPSFDLHGPFHRAGIMDPFCGGTRATLLLAQGDLTGAWSWNPLVPGLALTVVLLGVRAVVGQLSGRWIDVSMPRKAWLLAIGVLLIAVEINQQLQAGRLMNAVPAGA